MLALQRTAGNRAAATMLGRQVVVQRQPKVEDDVDEGIDKTTGALDFAGGHIGQWSGAAQFGMVNTGTDANPQMASNYTTGNTSSPGAEGGISSAGLGVLTGLTGTVTSSIGAHKGFKSMKEETEGGREGQAKWRVGKRQAGTGVANATSSSVNVASQGLSGISGISQVMANAGSSTAFAGANNLIGGVGGIIALPVQAFTVGRTARKLAKQGKRFAALRKSLIDPDTSAKEAAKALENHQESIRVADDAWQVLVGERNDAQAEIDKFKTAKAMSWKDTAKIQSLTGELALMNSAIVELGQKVTALNGQTATLLAAKAAAEAKMQEMVTRGQQGQESAEDVRMYATTKNKGGVVKKSIAVVGGLLGLGGGIAATIGTLAFAGVGLAAGVAVAATPVGWALAGAAALIGLGMAGYAFFKWYRKRLQRAEAEGLTGAKKYLTALNPFKKIGTSHREHMADRLWLLASKGGSSDPKDQQQATEAKRVIKDLGLDWDGLHMGDAGQEESAKKLIHDKMAS